MTGSLQVKYNKFYIVLNTYENGKRKPKWIPTDLPEKGNKRKAERLLREALKEYERTDRPVTSTMLFSDAVRQWLKVASLKVDIITLQGYQSIAENHVLPYFEAKGTKLSELTRPMLQAYINEKHERGRMTGAGGLSPASLRQHKNVLHQTLQEAMRNGIIEANPASALILPAAQQYQSKYYTEAQLKQLFEATKEERLFPLVYVTALYGLRRSELLGLKWDSIDWQRNTVTIKYTVCRMKTVVEKEKTKTQASHRTFPLTAEIHAIFERCKQEEEQNRLAFGREYQENDYIFKWEDGRPYAPDYVGHTFPKLLKRYDLPKIRFHDLRHSCGSFLLNNGYSLKEIQEWLGHSNIKTTADIYAHLDTSRKQNMATKVQELFAI